MATKTTMTKDVAEVILRDYSDRLEHDVDLRDEVTRSRMIEKVAEAEEALLDPKYPSGVWVIVYKTFCRGKVTGIHQTAIRANSVEAARAKFWKYRSSLDTEIAAVIDSDTLNS